MWKDRHSRPGWDTWYTTVGGRLFDDDPLDVLPPAERGRIERLLSNAFVAASAPTEGAPSPDALYLAAVLTKIVQRGKLPPVPASASAQLNSGLELDAGTVRSCVLPLGGLPLDRAIDLHPVYEQPFWNDLTQRLPAAFMWCTPQAPLDSLIGNTEGEERWVDFLLAVPWWEKAVVVELDGAEHASRTQADEARDRDLKRANITVHRYMGSDTKGQEELVDKLVSEAREWQGGAPPPTAEALRHVLGPTQLHRFIYAIATGIREGMLVKANEWAIQVKDETGSLELTVGQCLSLIAAVDDVWSLGVVPERIVVNGNAWIRSRAGVFQSGSNPVTVDRPDLTVVLEPLVPPHAVLPQTTGPTMVIRGAMLPVDMGWDELPSTERRNITVNESSRAGLGRLLAELFGYEDFREGQAEATQQVLAGGDSCVLLPTGAGKTLIYQLAGLLRPGMTVVVAPLKSLIDDQERRLHELGITRSYGIHSGRRQTREERQELLERIEAGSPFYLLIAPERLQVAAFRSALQEVAANSLVNLAVIDEAHCVSEWGHQFRTAYLKLGRNLRKLSRPTDDVKPPVLALTGTASPAVLRDVLIELEIDAEEPGALQRPTSFDRPNLRYMILTSERDRHRGVRRAIERVASELGVSRSELGAVAGLDTRSGIVFVPHSSSGKEIGVQALSEVVQSELQLDPSQVARYSGSLWKEGPRSRFRSFGKADLEMWGAMDFEDFKSKNAGAFRRNEVPVMVATSAFGMGIDKPNIRWTVHVTHPNSLEAFAQESGRAGRDGRTSACILVTSTPEADMGVQQYFHNSSFPPVDQELASIGRLIESLRTSGRPTARIVIPRPRQDAESDAVERALYRLMLIGLVDDYTIEYRAGTFTVDLANFSNASIDAATHKYIRQMLGSDTALVSDIELPADTWDRARAHAQHLIQVLHDTVVKGRRRALDEMHLMAVEAPSNREIHERLDAYLGAGMTSLVLDKIVRPTDPNTQLDLSGALALVQGSGVSSGQEWTGAASRYLESFPEHPVILIVRGLGEAWRGHGDRQVFSDSVTAALASIEKYGLGIGDAVGLFEWTLERLRLQFGGRMRSWSPDVWAAWEETPWPEDAVAHIEGGVLDRAAEGDFDPNELDVVLARRVRRLGRSAKGET